MTTGTILLDGQWVQGNSSSSSAKVGRYFRKTWSGADRPVEPLLFVSLYDPVKKRYYKKRERRRKTHFDQPNNWDCTIEDLSSPNITCWGPAIGTLTYCLNYGMATPRYNTSPWTSNHDLDLISKLHDQVYGSDFDPGVFLGELNQTLDLIGDSAKRLALGISKFRKGDFRGAARAFTGSKSRRQGHDLTAANAWIELQYGWKPLVQDMYDGAEMLAHQLHHPITLTFRATRTAKRTTPDSINGDRVQPAESHRTVRKQLIAYLRADHPPSSLALVNPATIAWELLPWSFVIDWAIPIGNYLAARGTAYSLKGTFVTTTLDWTHWSGQKPADIWITKVYPPQFPNRYDKKVYTRRVTSTITVPTPSFKGLGKALSWGHCENALALLTQQKHR